MIEASTRYHSLLHGVEAAHRRADALAADVDAPEDVPAAAAAVKAALAVRARDLFEVRHRLFLLRDHLKEQDMDGYAMDLTAALLSDLAGLALGQANAVEAIAS